MITRDQIADLRPGDVIELTWSEHPGHVVRSIVRLERDGLRIGPGLLAWANGDVASYLKDDASLTIVSRAPRPLYVNHPRTEPVPGDVAKDADGNEPSGHTWHYLGDPETTSAWWRFDDHLRNGQPKRLRLLVDGETGQVVS